MKTSDAADKCEMCNGRGMVGGFVNAENGYDAEECKDCKGSGKAPAMKTSDAAMTVGQALDIAESAIKPLECTRVLAAEVRRLRDHAAKLAPVECEPVGYALTDLFGQPRIEDDELTVKTYQFVCSDKTDCKPVYLHPLQSIDAEAKALAISVCDNIIDCIHSWSLIGDAKKLKKLLGAE